MLWPRVRKPVVRKASCPLAAPRLKFKQDLDMPQATTTISNKLGLHARASAKLTKLAGSFPCEVWIAKGERRVNAKSIMGVMMLAAGIGSEVTIDTDGEQAQEALDAVLAIIADKFGEGE
jgi:phosphocarrier protein